jgi:hypothetical protein
MFHDVDEVLRQLLIRGIPIRNGEVDVVFDQPTREWSARLSRPTLNLFLHNVRENVKLRGSQQWFMEQNPDGTVTQRRAPARVDLHYMITAWANEPDDEHNLLARSMMALLREPNLPQGLLPDSMESQPMLCPLQVAQEDAARNPGEVWNALDNELRPSISLMVTIAVDPYATLVTPLVRTRELRIGQAEKPAELQEISALSGTAALWTIGGTVHASEPVEDMVVRLIERGLEVALAADGQFAFSKLREGSYTLEVRVDGRTLKSQTISVPAPDYEIHL